MLRNKLTLLSLGLFLMTISAKAETILDKRMIIAPSCLMKHASIPYQLLSKTHDLMLMSIQDQYIEKLAASKKHQKESCGGFIDVTSDWQSFATNHHVIKNRAHHFLMHYSNQQNQSDQHEKTYRIQYPTEVNQLLNHINPAIMWTNLTALTAFPDRSARTESGVKAAAWLKNEVETIAKNAERDDVSAYFVETNGYLQPSLVVKMGKSNEPGIVIGGHMDTLSSRFGLKPGADDDGSGSVTVLEVARTLLTSQMQFKKPIYFMWDAAEEAGLIGSQHVVAAFKKKDIPIDAVIQFDMTGYAYKNDPTIWLMQDYVNKNLTAYLETLINTYVKQPIQYTKCGYACSDHDSWNRAGFAASMPFEAKMGNDDPYIHTAQDTMDLLSLNHMTNFAKLGVAFAVELAEPVQ